MTNAWITSEEFKYEIKFPKLMWYHYSTQERRYFLPEIIALVNEDGTGTILVAYQGSSYKVGEKITDGLNTNYWKDLLGKVVLSNQVTRVELNQDKFNELQ